MTARACPKCGETLPAAGAGPARCPHCQHDLVPDLELGDEPPPLQLQHLPPPPRPLLPVLVSSEQAPGRPPAPVNDGEWRRCARCRARVRPTDAHCFLCGQPQPGFAHPEVEEEDAAPRRRDYEPHRASLIATLGRVSVIAGGVSFAGIAFLPLAAVSVLAAAAGIGGVVMARDDLELMERQVMDPAGRQDTLAAQSQSTIGIVLGIAGALLSLLVKMPSLLA